MDFSCKIPYFDEEWKIVRAELYTLHPIPLKRPFADATMPYNDHVGGAVLYLYDESGAVGWARSGGGVLVERVLPEVLTGKRERFGDVYERIFWKRRNDGYSSPTFGALAGLDKAAINLFAARKGLQTNRYLGAERDWHRVYASAHGCLNTIEEMLEEVEEEKALGYDFYKMKIGTDFGTKLDWDVERVRIMRDAIGPDAKLAIDANQLWNADEAMRFIDRVEKYDIYWYEEPVHSHDLVELEKLCRMSPVRVSMGESLRNSCFFKAYADAGCGVLQGNGGWGYFDWLKIYEMTKAYGIEFSANTSSADYMSALDNEDVYMEYLRPNHKPTYELMKRRPEDRDGKFFLSHEPGSTFEPDWDLIKEKKLLKSIEVFYPRA